MAGQTGVDGNVSYVRQYGRVAVPASNAPASVDEIWRLTRCSRYQLVIGSQVAGIFGKSAISGS